MKRHFSLVGILFFLVLMLPQAAFADIAPGPSPRPDTPTEQPKDNDDDCSALPLTQNTQNWPVLLILMLSMGAVSMGAIYRLNRKSVQSTDK